jgi:hypothetical protein
MALRIKDYAPSGDTAWLDPVENGDDDCYDEGRPRPPLCCWIAADGSKRDFAHFPARPLSSDGDLVLLQAHIRPRPYTAASVPYVQNNQPHTRPTAFGQA